MSNVRATEALEKMNQVQGGCQICSSWREFELSGFYCNELSVHQKDRKDSNPLNTSAHRLLAVQSSPKPATELSR